MGARAASSSPNSTSVQVAIAALTERSVQSTRPTLIGFEASRHLTRADFGAAAPPTVDMPISEETIVGAAIGLALAGRDVVVDLMFEGFLSRCLEPLLVGWSTAVLLADRALGQVVIRMLAAPVDFGGPSHSADVLAMLDGSERLLVVHVSGPDDVTWALTVATDRTLLLADPVRPDLLRGERVRSTPGSVPLLLWRDDRAGARVVVCTHALAPALVAEIETGAAAPADLISSPVAKLESRDVARFLAPYDEIDLRGVSVAGA